MVSIIDEDFDPTKDVNHVTVMVVTPEYEMKSIFSVRQIEQDNNALVDIKDLKEGGISLDDAADITDKMKFAVRCSNHEMLSPKNQDLVSKVLEENVKDMVKAVTDYSRMKNFAYLTEDIKEKTNEDLDER